MSGDSAASAPGRSGARPGRPVGRMAGARLRNLFEGGLLEGGVQGSPVIRLLLRWVRRPLLPVMRLWRRNIQLRVVATTLVMSLGVVLLLGFVVIGQVRNGLLDAKVKASQSQATGGFAVAKQKADEAASGAGTGAAAGAGTAAARAPSTSSRCRSATTAAAVAARAAPGTSTRPPACPPTCASGSTTG